MLSDDTKPLRELMLASHQWGSVELPECDFIENAQDVNNVNVF